MIEQDGRYVFGLVKVNDKGQIVIPKDARRIYNIKPGDSLLVVGDQRGIALATQSDYKQLQELLDMLLGNSIEEDSEA